MHVLHLGDARRLRSAGGRALYHLPAAAAAGGPQGNRGLRAAFPTRRQQCDSRRMKGFRGFLLRGNVVDLAIGIVIGAAFGTVVTALVKDFITPLIAAAGGKPDFAGLYFTVNGSKFMYGDFVNALIAFVLIAAVVYYFVVVPYSRFRDRFDKPEEPPLTRECPECLSRIPLAAKRCSECGQPVPAGG